MTQTSNTRTDARPAALCWACGEPTSRDESWRPADLNRCSSCGLLFAPERMSAAGVGDDEEAFVRALEPVSADLAAAA